MASYPNTIEPGSGARVGPLVRPNGRAGSPRAGGTQRGFATVQEERFAHSLGWFGIGLGLAQLLAPRRLARMIGVPEHPALMRALGLREMASGVGILKSDDPATWLWARTGGDVMDLALLGAAMRSDAARRNRIAIAVAAVLGVALADLLSSQRVTGHPRARLRERARAGAIPLERSIVVNAPPAECYAYWRDLARLPTFMKHLERVELRDERRSHWVARAPMGATVEWDAEIVEDVPNERLAWRSVAGAQVANAGVVRFERAPGGRGTVVRVHLRYEPPAGQAGAVIARLFNESPEVQVREDIRRFKRLIETGEVPTTEGQPSGRRSAVVELISKARP